MAANNYFGFTHSGTQYAAAGTPTYQAAPQTGYAVAQTAAAAAAATYPQRAATGYESYQQAATPGTYAVAAGTTAPATYDFGYATRAAPPAAYDTTKTYYQQAAPAATQAYSTADYQAVYSAAMYVNQGKQNNAWQGGGFKKQGGGKQMMNKPQQPKPQQLHYCEVCKISCAGPQTYREHLEGQRHKKKEALAKEGTSTSQQSGSRSSNNLRCELCDVVCTGSDAYAAHLRGSKHRKVVKLHTILGKPIPEVDVKAAKAAAAGGGSSVASATVTAPPKINFIQSGTLGTVPRPDAPKEDIPKEEPVPDVEMSTENEVTPVGQEYIEEIRSDDGKLISFNCKLCECKFNDPNAKDMHMKGRRHRLQYKKKVNPDLVVEVKPSGRRGRLQEEKLRRRDDFIRRREEDRSFWTDDRMHWEERRRYEDDFEYMDWMRRRGPMPPAPFLQPIPFGIRRLDTPDDRHIISKHQTIYPKEPKMQAVHRVVAHVEKSLKLVSDQLLVDNTKETPAVVPVKKEAPQLTAPANNTNAVKKDEAPATNDSSKTASQDKPNVGPIDDKDNNRIIKGVMRVGILAKGLLLADENTVDLVVLCGDIPTKQLLTQVYNLLSSQLKIVAGEEGYIVTLDMAEACVTVSTAANIEPSVNVNVTLTSPVLREMLEGEGGSLASVNLETLDHAKCLEALAQLRRSKWFQARPANNHSSVLVIRILRDLCHRNPTWTPLSQWAIELLVDKVVGYVAFSVAEALRKVLEAIAGGVLLPNSAGLADPCEREPTDAIAHLSPQQRADITASAQHALRLMAFRQIHKVLGMAPVPPTRGGVAGGGPGGQRHPQRFTRKRRRDHSAGETPDSEAGDGKKDKKEGEGATTSGAAEGSSMEAAAK